MRWLLGLAVLLGLVVHRTWAQGQNWAVWNAAFTGSSASGTVQSLTGAVTFTFAVNPTDGGTANGGYYITGVGNATGTFSSTTAYGPGAPQQVK